MYIHSRIFKIIKANTVYSAHFKAASEISPHNLMRAARTSELMKVASQMPIASSQGLRMYALVP